MGFKDTYVFTSTLNNGANKRSGAPIKPLESNENVIWADKQYSIRREKRDYISRDDIQSKNGTNHKVLAQEDMPLIREKRTEFDILEEDKLLFNDDLWSQEWYLHDTRSIANLPKLDLNVLPVYERGITGKGIRVAILDDGLEHTHEDLNENYDPDISWDCNDNDPDPSPTYDGYKNAHGTRCAGEVAMIANNRKCGVGIAFNAKVGGIKLLGGVVNDRIEGVALGFANHLVDIYSASWGPSDDGKTVDGPGRLALEAMTKGIREGRNGRGVIYIWASGNGGSKGDNCNCDGYTGSVYTISIGSASQKGTFPWYGEQCPSTLAVTYSSGAYEDQMIATTDLRNRCTIKHTGTSASAPLAAGIIALALEVNPNLTWRDVQHLIVWTSEYTPLMDNNGWVINRAGFQYNIRFGFGLMNADSIVIEAEKWAPVPEKNICEIQSNPILKKTLIHGQSTLLTFSSSGCNTATNTEIGAPVNFVEHIEVRANIKYTRRGDLEIYLTSPGGTNVQLLGPRKLDDSRRGFTGWHFMSVATWGESSIGNWELQIEDMIGSPTNKGELGNFTLILHGTEIKPLYLNDGPRRYNDHYIRRTGDTHQTSTKGNRPHPSTKSSTTLNENKLDDKGLFSALKSSVYPLSSATYKKRNEILQSIFLNEIQKLNSELYEVGRPREDPAKHKEPPLSFLSDY